jgi:monoamine oxidase
MHDCDVVVVGAGLAGLTAARELAGAGLDVRVLEARDRVGRRNLSRRVGDHPEDIVELGGQWVGPTQHEVIALAEELGIDTYPTHVRGKNLFEDDRGKLKRYRGTIPMLGPLVMVGYGRADLRLKRLIKRVSAETPWEAEDGAIQSGKRAAAEVMRTEGSALATAAGARAAQASQVVPG